MATSELHEVILMQTEFIALNKSLSSPTGNNPPPPAVGAPAQHTHTHTVSPPSQPKQWILNPITHGSYIVK